MSSQPRASLIAYPPYLSAAVVAAYLIIERRTPVITAEKLNTIVNTDPGSTEVIGLFTEDIREFFRSLNYSGDFRETLESFKRDFYTLLATMVAKNHYTLDKIGLTYCIIPIRKPEVTYYTIYDVIRRYREPGKTITNPLLTTAMVDCIRDIDPHLYSLIVDQPSPVSK